MHSRVSAKVLSATLSLMMIIDAVPMYAFAEEGNLNEQTVQESSADGDVQAYEDSNEEFILADEETIKSSAESSGEEEALAEADLLNAQTPEIMDPASGEDAAAIEDTAAIEQTAALEQAEDFPGTDSLIEEDEFDAPADAAFQETVSVPGGEIAVSAPEGAFSDGAALSVEEVSAGEQAGVDAAVEQLRGGDRRVAASYTFDVKVLGEDGVTELEPAQASSVKVFFRLAEASDPNLEASVYHVSQDAATGELLAEQMDVLRDESIPDGMDAADPESVVAVETDGFSYYTVEFTYDKLQYVLEGDSSVLLEDILLAVGLFGEVQSVEVSDDTLLGVSDEAGVWTVSALQAFTTTEWMRVIIDGVAYEITVTDDGPAQYKKTIATATTYQFHGHTFENKGTLTATPASAAAGETVTLTLDTQEHYGLKEMKAYDTNSQEIQLSFAEQDNNTWTFTVPDGDNIDTYQIVAELEWESAPPTESVLSRIKDQKICIDSDIQHGTVAARYLEFAGAGSYRQISSKDAAGQEQTIRDMPATVWLYAEPEEGYRLAGWKVESLGYSLPVEYIENADPSPWLFELGAYNFTYTFHISAVFEEIQEPGYEPHKITTNYRDVTAGGEPTGSSVRTDVSEAKKGDIVTVSVDLQPGTCLSQGEGGLLTVYSSLATGGTTAIQYTKVDDNTYTFEMPDKDVTVLALFDYVWYQVTPAPLEDGSYVHYAFYRNGTDLDHQIGAGYYDTGSTQWKNTEGQTNTEGQAEWKARPTDKVALDVDVHSSNKDMVPRSLLLINAETNEPVGAPLPLSVRNETGTVYRAETVMPACDVTFQVRMAPVYSITMNESDCGTLGSYPQRAREGETIRIWAKPKDSRYDIAWTATWTDAQGTETEVEVTKDPENGLEASFVMPAGNVKVIGEFSLWRSLQEKINAAQNGDTIRLESSYTAIDGDTHLIVNGKQITIDLNGYTIDRALTQAKSNDGHVFYVTGGAELTITDSGAGSGDAETDSADGQSGAGIIKGGYAGNGGGIYVDGGSTLNIKGGLIAGNQTTGSGGGIYVESGSLNMTGGMVASNSANGSGGGIYVANDGRMSLENAVISGNFAGSHGGGLHIRLAKDATIKDCRISENSSGKFGGGLRLDAKGRKLKIEDTTISGNSSLDDGAGIHLNNGAIEMNGGMILNNVSYYDGGGVKVAGNAAFTAAHVTIKDNKTFTEEGGGIKNNGTATLDYCTITENEAAARGGGIFNDNEGSSAGTLTLYACTVSGNHSGSEGGGVYSDKALTIIGGEILGNSAQRGGGVFAGSGSDNTNVQGSVLILNNTASSYGSDLFLKSGRRLALTGALTDGAEICVDLESGTGVLTKGYQEANGTEDPEQYFTFTRGYFTRFTDEGEVEICSDWPALKKEIESAASGTVILLDKDYAAGASDDRIIIAKNITIDLNGYVLNRNRMGKKDNGRVLEVSSGGTLTIRDGSNAGDGMITGGWSENGGGIYVNKSATLNLEGGQIAGNRADAGGGIYSKGTLNLSGGRIEGNTADRSGGILVEDGTINIQGTPVVSGNSATKSGNDVWLPSERKLRLTGPLTEGARIGIAIEGGWGVFTSGYPEYNKEDAPERFFVSTENHGVILENGEAALGLITYGGTEYEDPFISGKNQINTDAKTLGGQNWMSGISGERYLNEINTPGSHDSGMNNVQNIETSQGITWVVAGFSVLSAAVSLLTAGTASIGIVGLAAIGLSVILPNDYTSALGFFLEDAAAPMAKTQKEYIFQQLEEGCRQLDLRLYHKHKVYKWYINGYKYEDDKENLWVCHGKKGGGRYLALDDDGRDLSFKEVLSWVKEFLKKHPTETIVLDLRPETEDDDEKEKIYPRARKILEASAMEINPSTGEPYLYKEPGSGDYFAAYDKMPKLADCRGKIVIMPENADFREKVGGFVRGDGVVREHLSQLDYENTKTQMVDQVQKEYSKANGDGSVSLLTDVGERLNRLWYWELNCTGQHAGIGYLTMDAPHKLAEYVNSHVVGDDKVLGAQRTGKYIGWVRFDSFKAEYAEQIWRTNFFDGLEYCTVTVKSGLDDEKNYPDQTYQVLKGTVVTLPGNIYKKLGDGHYFKNWKSDDGASYQPYTSFEVNKDVTFTAHWLEENQIPVSIVWKDGNNKDGLRPADIDLAVSAGGQASIMTLTEEGGWSSILTAQEGTEGSIEIIPQWNLIDITGGGAGQDAVGTYRYELSHEAGTGYIITFIHTPQARIPVSGTVSWVDEENTAGKRPEKVTISLVENGVPTGATAGVSAQNNWQYTFGERPQYENGEEIVYSVAEDEIDGYETDISGYSSVVNTYASAAQSTVNVEGIVQWDDAGNAKGLRPEKAVVRLLAGSVEAAGTPKAEPEPSASSFWYWRFEDLPVLDAEGGRIEYNVAPAEVDGYTVTCERINPGEADAPADSESASQDNPSSSEAAGSDGELYLFLITYTLKVEEEEKTGAKITVAPAARELTYSAAAQRLIEEGEAEGGRLMYAVGDDKTRPDASSFSTELPTGTDAGTYCVWYFVKGDVMHTDTVPECLAVVIGKAKQTIQASDVSGTAGDAGRAIKAAAAGVDGAAEGVGALRFAVTDGTDVAGVDADTGALTLLKQGTATVTVTAGETANYAAALVQVKVSVAPRKHTLTFFEDTQGTKVWKQFMLDDGTPLSEYTDYGRSGQDESNLLRKDGWTLAGWAKEPVISVHSYRDKEGTLNQALEGKLFDFSGAVREDVNAYPIWIRDRLEVHLVTGGNDTSPVILGIGGDSLQQSDRFVVNIGEKIDMTGLNAATRAGYVLDGWYTQGGVKWDKDGSWEVTPKYCDRDKNGDTILNDDIGRRFRYYTVTLTARWKRIQEAPGIDARALDDHTVQVNEPVSGAQYLIVPAGEEPAGSDWDAARGIADGKVVFDDLEPATSYDVWARMAATEDALQSEPAKVTVTTRKAVQNAPSAPAAEAVSEERIAVSHPDQAQMYAIVPAGEAAPGDESDLWRSPDKNGKAEWTGLAGGTSYDVYARYAETASAYASPASVPTRVALPATEIILYTNTGGDGLEWTKGSGLTAVFTFKRSVRDSETFSHFQGIQTDGTEVAASDYTAGSGSVIISLKPSFLERLSVGGHTLTAMFEDGNSPTARFTVVAAKEDESSDSDQKDKEPDGTDQKDKEPDGTDQKDKEPDGTDQKDKEPDGTEQKDKEPDGTDQKDQNRNGTNQNGVNQNGTAQSGANQTGVNQSGTNQNGANQTGVNQSGTNQNGANQVESTGRTDTSRGSQESTSDSAALTRTSPISPRTSDESNPSLWLMLMAASLALLILVITAAGKRKRGTQKP